MHYRALRILSMSLVILGLAASGLALEPSEESSEVGSVSSGSTSFAARLFGQYLAASDVDDTSGDVEIIRAGVDLSFRHAASDQLVFNGSFQHEGSDYDFDRASGLFPGSVDGDSPFDTLHESGFSLGMTYRVDEVWSLFATGFIGAGYESGADLGDGLFGGGFGGFGYRFSDAFSLQLGVGVRTKIEEDPLVIPLIGFRWQITDSLRLESEGIAARLIWQTCDELQLGLFARYFTRDYRTDQDNPYLPDGVFRDDRVTVGALADWSPTPSISLKVELGAAVWQEYTFANSSGDEINKTESDPQFLLAASFELRF